MPLAAMHLGLAASVTSPLSLKVSNDHLMLPLRRSEGYEVILVNSNPATIMTDPGTADRTCAGVVLPCCK